MEPRINVITLGVEDLKKSKRFYENMGFKSSSISNEHFVAFQLSGVIFCLYPRKLLAEDITTANEGNGFRGVTLAYNVLDKQDVQPILDQAQEQGGKIIKPAQDVFWGGYSGYFADPDGHLWEVAWNPFWKIGEDGIVRLPE